MWKELEKWSTILNLTALAETKRHRWLTEMISVNENIEDQALQLNTGEDNALLKPYDNNNVIYLYSIL